MPEVREPLAPLERRILGVLVEKQKTSKNSDTYPLTLNALTTGCNQKSNRDPVMETDEVEVEECVDVLQKKGFVTRLTSSRVDRFKHELYDRWTRNGAEMAVIAELLLRGPQTKGELRTRAGRMDPIDSLEALDELLKPMVENGLVVYLTEPDRRGAMLTHGFHTADELKVARSHAAGLAVEEIAAPRSVVPPPPNEIAELKTRVAALESQLAELRRQLGLES